MKTKRIFALLLALMMVLSLAACAKQSASDDGAASAAADFPKEDINMYIGYGAGGGSDLLARALAKYIDLGDHVMVCTNLTGGSGTIAMMECWNAEPDGYSMNLCLPESFAVQVLNGSMEKDVFDKLIFLASPVYDVNTLSVRSDAQWQTLDELISYAQENPGKLTIAGVGSGVNKLWAVEIMQKLGIELKYVPYDDSNSTRAALRSTCCCARPASPSRTMIPRTSPFWRPAPTRPCRSCPMSRRSRNWAMRSCPVSIAASP